MKRNKTASIHRIQLRRETVRDLSSLRLAAAGAQATTPPQCLLPTTTVLPTHQVACLTN
jgi:hypothetical protein